jgi:transposase-like protein
MWYEKIRAICNIKMQSLEKIGGLGKVIQIDESVVSKRKYNRGRLSTQKWVFAAIDTVSKDFIIKYIDDRTRETLRNVIVDTINEESIIHSDCWSSYISIFSTNNSFKHYTVNHSKNFVNPETGVHTNLVENLWMRLKNTLRRRYLRNSDNLESYISEFCWRKKFGGEKTKTFESFLNEIKI